MLLQWNSINLRNCFLFVSIESCAFGTVIDLFQIIFTGRWLKRIQQKENSTPGVVVLKYEHRGHQKAGKPCVAATMFTPN